MQIKFRNSDYEKYSAVSLIVNQNIIELIKSYYTFKHLSDEIIAKYELVIFKERVLCIPRFTKFIGMYGTFKNYPIIDKQAFLEGASSGGNENAVKKYLDDKTLDFHEILRNASEYNHPNVVKLMLDKELGCYNCALIAACRFGNEKLIRLILAKDVNPSVGLLGAYENGDRKIIDMLKNEYGAKDTDYYEFRGNCSAGRLHITAGCDLNHGLERAAKKGHLHLVKELIRRGANSFHMAASAATKHNYLDVVEFLIQKLSVAEISSIAHIANSKECMELFMKYGVECRHFHHAKIFEFGMVELFDKCMSYWDIEYACKFGYFDFAQKRVDAGVKMDVNILCSYGGTDIIKFMLRNNIDKNSIKFYLLQYKWNTQCVD